MVRALKARVRNGHLVVEDPTDLPEGTEVELLMPVDEGDELDDEDRARLHAALEQSERDFAEGRYVSAEVVLARLRAKHT